MPNWKHISHFLYGKGFWYADPIHEIKGLSIFEYFACFAGYLNSIIDI